MKFEAKKLPSRRRPLKKQFSRQSFNVNQPIWTTLHGVFTYSMFVLYIYILYYLLVGEIKLKFWVLPSGQRGFLVKDRPNEGRNLF